MTDFSLTTTIAQGTDDDLPAALPKESVASGDPCRPVGRTPHPVITLSEMGTSLSLFTPMLLGSQLSQGQIGDIRWFHQQL